MTTKKTLPESQLTGEWLISIAENHFRKRHAQHRIYGALLEAAERTPNVLRSFKVYSTYPQARQAKT